jgi:pyridoxamine 5'-phosphate oxidase
MIPADDDPIDRFLAALAKARDVEPRDPTAMTLATADARGRPSARMVLLKAVDRRGFVFYTNHASRKARELEENPFAALSVHWPTLGQQVRVEGRAARIADDESDAYFASRPRESQLGAWASRQSAPLASRDELEARVRAIAERFPREIPRPSFWGGYRVEPHRIEFWYDGRGRLHDRFLYVLGVDGSWITERLYP